MRPAPIMDDSGRVLPGRGTRDDGRTPCAPNVGRTANCPVCGAVLVWKLNPEKPGWWIARCECKDLHNNVDNDW